MQARLALRRFRDDRAGSITILSAFMVLILLGFAALAIDAGQFYVMKRRQQTATDIAATAAAADLGRASAAAIANLAANGYPAATLVSVETGSYAADPTLPASQRFVPGPAGNAVRITVRSNVSFVFGGLISPASAAPPLGVGGSSAPAGISIRTVAVGLSSDVAAFSVGSRLAELDGGMLNSVLGGLLGTRLSLSLGDYRALAGTSVDLFGVSNAVAAQAGVTGTYSALAATRIRTSDVLSALSSAAAQSGASGSALAALMSLENALGVSSSRLPFGTLIGFGPYGTGQIGSSAPVAAKLSVLDLLFGAAEIANGPALVQASVVSTLPGIAAVSLKLAVGEPAVGSSFAAIGPTGTTVHTAQTRVLVSLQLLGAGSIPAVNLPIYLEAASATGRVASFACPAVNPAQAQVQIGVTPGLVNGWIGAVSTTDFTSLSTPVSPGPATLVSLAGLASVTGRSHVTMGNMQETLLTFTASDIAAGAIKTVSTTDELSSMVSQLFASLQLNVTVLGLGLGVPVGLDTGTAAILAADTASIDLVLSEALTTLGLTLGDADTAVDGIRCGQGSLVD